MSKIAVVFSTRSEHQSAHAKACFKALKKLGHEVQLCTSHYQVKRDFNNVVIWGWRESQFHKNKNICVLERGYVGDRFKYTSIGFNGLNGLATFYTIPSNVNETNRYECLISNKFDEWNPEGEYALICGQTPGDMSLRGKDLMPWYKEIVKKINANHPGLEIRFRQHPNLTKKGIVQEVEGTVHDTQEYADSFKNSKFVCVFNSNSAIDALNFGKPIYVEDQGSMVYSVANHSLFNMDFSEPNRKSIFENLMWTQYNLEEIESGFPLKHCQWI